MTDTPAVPVPAGMTGPQFLEPGAPPCGCGPDEQCCKCPEARVMARGLLAERREELAAADTWEADGGAHVRSADEAPAAAVPPPADQERVEPLFAGTYAIYDDGAKGAVLVLAQRGGETVHRHIPAAMLKMAERFGSTGGGLGGLLGGMFGR